MKNVSTQMHSSIKTQNDHIWFYWIEMPPTNRNAIHVYRPYDQFEFTRRTDAFILATIPKVVLLCDANSNSNENP